MSTEDAAAEQREIRVPPPQVRRNFYLFDSRVPPTWSAWVEREIQSAAWLYREIARFFVAFLVLPILLGRWRFSLWTLVLLALGAGVIVATQGFLRKIALEFQRYGGDWSQSPHLQIGRYANLGLAMGFSLLFIILTQQTFLR